MRRIGLFCIAFFVMMLLVLLAFLSGVLSAMGMAVAYIVLIFLGILVLSIIIKSTTFADGAVRRPLTASPLSKMILSPRVLGILIAISIGAFVYGIWSTQNAPLLPRITGMTVNICMTIALIVALRKSKRNSKG
jgi:hypothetical protein